MAYGKLVPALVKRTRVGLKVATGGALKAERQVEKAGKFEKAEEAI